MRLTRFVIASTCLVLGAGAADAQPPSLSALEMTIACGPPPSLDRPGPSAPRVAGSQDTVARTLFGPRDLIVINAGAASGLQLGQQFFVRRQTQFGTAFGEQALSAQTLGWISVVAVNDTTAVAAVDHACGGIMVHDYLEPFVAPKPPADAERDVISGEPDFSAVGRVLAGNDDRRGVAPGDLVMIDPGSLGSFALGTRLAVYRDVRMTAVPLAIVGDAVVVSAGPSIALARVTRARDAVQTGDYVVVRK